MVDLINALLCGAKVQAGLKTGCWLAWILARGSLEERGHSRSRNKDPLGGEGKEGWGKEREEGRRQRRPLQNV